MTSIPVQRALALAGVTLLATILALAIALPHARSSLTSSLPRAIPAVGGGWYHALAAPYTPPSGHRTACGERLDARTLGVAHPVLPCGAKLYIAYEGREVLTEVVDRGPHAPGREFNITKALADRIDLHGVKTIRWRFAG